MLCIAGKLDWPPLGLYKLCSKSGGGFYVTQVAKLGLNNMHDFSIIRIIAEITKSELARGDWGEERSISGS